MEYPVHLLFLLLFLLPPGSCHLPYRHPWPFLRFRAGSDPIPTTTIPTTTTAAADATTTTTTTTTDTILPNGTTTFTIEDVLSDVDRDILDLIMDAPNPSRLLHVAERIPAIHGCPDYHLKITRAEISDAFLACRALGKLSSLCQDVGHQEQEAATCDRRFEQILECIGCHADDLEVSNVAEAVLGLSLLRVRQEELLGSFSKAVEEKMHSSPPSSLLELTVAYAHAYDLLGYRPPAFLTNLTSLVAQSFSSYNAADIAHLAWAIGVFQLSSPLTGLVAEAVMQDVQAFPIKNLSAISWALHRLNYQNSTSVMSVIAAGSTGKLAELPTQELAQLAKAVAKADAQPNDLFMLETLVCAEARREQFHPSHLADVLWSFGKVRFFNATAFLLREVPYMSQQMEDYSAVDIAKILWAYARILDGEASSVMSSIAGRASVLLESRLLEFEPVYLAQLAWALSSLGYYTDDLFTGISGVLERRLTELTLTDLSNVAWAFAKSSHPRHALFDQIALVLELRHEDFSPNDLTMCLWALASAGYRLKPKTPFCIPPDHLKQLGPSETAKLLWALAKVQIMSPEFIEEVTNDVQTKLLTFSPADLASTAWALGALYQRGSTVLDVLVPAVGNFLELFSDEELATILSCFVRLKHQADELMERIQTEVEKRLAALASPPSGDTVISRPISNPSTNFHLSKCQELLSLYKNVDFNGGKSKGKYELGKSILSNLL